MEKGNDFPSKDSVGRLRRHACLVQVEFLQQIYDSLKARQAAGSAAVSSMDLGSIFMAGHSRGGKLAALHFAAGAAQHLHDFSMCPKIAYYFTIPDCLRTHTAYVSS